MFIGARITLSLCVGTGILGGVRLRRICVVFGWDKRRRALCFGVSNATRRSPRGGAESENGEIPNKFRRWRCSRGHNIAQSQCHTQSSASWSKNESHLIGCFHGIVRAIKSYGVSARCGDGRPECVTAHFGPKKRISGDTNKQQPWNFLHSANTKMFVSSQILKTDANVQRPNSHKFEDNFHLTFSVWLKFYF